MQGVGNWQHESDDARHPMQRQAECGWWAWPYTDVKACGYLEVVPSCALLVMRPFNETEYDMVITRGRRPHPDDQRAQEPSRFIGQLPRTTRIDGSNKQC